MGGKDESVDAHILKLEQHSAVITVIRTVWGPSTRAIGPDRLIVRGVVQPRPRPHPPPPQKEPGV